MPVRIYIAHLCNFLSLDGDTGSVRADRLVLPIVLADPFAQLILLIGRRDLLPLRVSFVAQIRVDGLSEL